MHAIKKLFIYIMMILFLISIYKDLTTGTPLNSDPSLQPEGHKMEQEQLQEQKQEQETITAIKRQVNNGDTVLSIVEDINQDKRKQLAISQIMADFKTMNPNTAPLRIQSGEHYYFPLYK